MAQFLTHETQLSTPVSNRMRKHSRTHTQTHRIMTIREGEPAVLSLMISTDVEIIIADQTENFEHTQADKRHACLN